MHDRDNDDLFGFDPKVDAKWKSSNEGASGVSVHQREAPRRLSDDIEKCLDFVKELMTETWTLLFVPPRGVVELLLSGKA